MILPTGGKQTRLAAPGWGGAPPPAWDEGRDVSGEESRKQAAPRRRKQDLVEAAESPRPAAPPTGSVYLRWSGSGGYFQQTRGRRRSEVGPRRLFQFEVRFCRDRGCRDLGAQAGGPTAVLKNRRGASGRRNRADHLRTEGTELGSVRIRSGLSCLAPMSGLLLLLLWGSSGSRPSLFRGVNQSSLVLQGLIESLKPTQQW